MDKAMLNLKEKSSKISARGRGSHYIDRTPFNHAIKVTVLKVCIGTQYNKIVNW